MSKEMVISATPHETRVAILEEGQLCEIYVEREKEFALVGSIYKGKVTRVLPGMQSSFVDIGLDSDAFLYVSDFLEEIEDLDHVVTTVEDKEHKMEDQGGQIFSTDAAGHTSSLEPTDVEPAPAIPEAVPQDLSQEAQPPVQAQPSSSRPPQQHSGPRHDSRPPRRFEGRGRDNRGGFGRGGGRGRGGRDHRGGRPGGDRRFGRDLPHSKYASHRPYEPEGETAGGAAPGNFVPVLLPGETLSRFKDAPATPSASAAPAVLEAPETPVIQDAGAIHESSAVQEAPAVQETERAPRRFEQRFSAPAGSAFAPLPGETLRHFESPAEEPAPDALSEPESTQEEFDRMATNAIEASSVPPVEEAPAEEIADATADLTEDEAKALAEHVAEAQLEEAEREERDQSHEESALADHSAEESTETEEYSVREEATEPEFVAGDAATADEESATESEAGAEIEEAGQEGHGAELAESAAASAGIAPLEGETVGSGQPQEWRATMRPNFRARMQHPARRGGGGGRDRGRDRGDRGGDRGRRDERGGRRPHHGHGGHRVQPRRTQLISDLLKQGQEIIVQIAKEPLGKKGARITSHVALPGRFLVYMPTLDHTGVSRKIASAEDRARLRHLVTEAKGSFGGGFIVRTAAGQATPEEVRADVEFLTHTWAEIKSRADQRKAPALLHRDLNLVERILRDYLTTDYTAIWVDSEEEYTKVVDFVSRFQPQLVNRVKLYTKDTPVFEEFGIQQEIDKGLRPKVWLKSGGYIVINHTEALVAIDVNTGKFVGKGSNRLEDTIVRTNLEAVSEVVRQMRLRDLGGIIIIDFIDMEERRNREKVFAALEEALKADRAPSKALRFNEFGLVAITRKRTKQALERTLCQPCPYCTGSGMVKSIPTLCYEIQAEARKMAGDIEAGSLTLRVHPEIAKALKTRESGLMEELERWVKKSVIIQADPTLHWEQYDIY